MNRPPEKFVRVPLDALQRFNHEVYLACGLSPEQAATLAEILAVNDARGVFSHGTRQTATYSRLFTDGILNPRPEVRVVRESPTTCLIDGDGGLGYFASLMAADWVAARAAEMGVAVVVTRNHGHFGAAGIYARKIVTHGLMAYITSGHQLQLKQGDSVLHGAGGSPMSFAVPAGEEPDLVLDFGAMHDFYPGSDHLETMIPLAPSALFRSIGLGNVCQALGGFLAGVPLDPSRAERTWSGANQGSFMVAVDLTRFLSREQFEAEMDAYSRRVRELDPLPGFPPATLPGGLELQRETEAREQGVPVGSSHAALLSELATRFGLSSPAPDPDSA